MDLYAIASMVASLGEGPAKLVNRIAINQLVNVTRNRPHPWSTEHEYISWSALTDRTHNARQLPAAPLQVLPPEADVADLFRAPEPGQERCRKSTCLFPAFAQYLTDGFIRTHIIEVFGSPDAIEKRTRTTSNHEIDMSPLYGRTREQTSALRERSSARGRRGRLLSQRIGDEEFPPFLFVDDGTRFDPRFLRPDGTLILDLPLGTGTFKPHERVTLFAVGGDRVNAAPQIAMMNTLFLREHNRLAAALEQANPHWDDDRVFETARNVVIVTFIKIVVEEYINHINQTPLKLRADPSVAWRARWNRPNWITAEFSLLYRWHPLVPETMTWGGRPYTIAQTGRDNTLLIQGGLRQAFIDVSANIATALKLGNTAKDLVPMEIRAVRQARQNRIDTYNAYRDAYSLAKARSFEDITPDPTLQSALQRLYGHPNNVEFYVGLFAEPRQTNGPLPELLQTMVAVDAFSQALTNPLLSEHVWSDRYTRKSAFTALGLDAIEGTTRLRDVLDRNCKNLGDAFVGMTRSDWVRH